MLKYFILVTCFFVISFDVNAQTPVSSSASRQYATQIRLRQLQELAGVSNSMAAVEQFTANYKPAGPYDTITIALVWHLLPLPDDVTPTSISDIEAQIERLNRDFCNPSHPYLGESYQQPAQLYDSEGNPAGTEADFQPYLHVADREEKFAQRAGLPLIRFCLAAYDPNGLPTTGIIKSTGTARLWSLGDTVYQTSSGGSAAWAPARYCNIWVARLADGYAGYAQLPGGPTQSDGIVLDDRFLTQSNPDSANPYALGRTLVHLMGSYLNLYELWNEFEPCADDYVEDTPIHNAPNNLINPYLHVSTCFSDLVAEMPMNFMDNTIDTGQYMFTRGQVTRMRATLADGGSRGGLALTPVACDEGSNNSAPRGSEGDAQLSNNNLWTRVFPNPTAEDFIVEIEYNKSTDIQLLIFDSRGAMVHQQKVVVGAGVLSRHSISSTNWAQGMYTVVIQTDSIRISEKVMIER